jgi:hypothetical protein
MSAALVLQEKIAQLWRSIATKRVLVLQSSPLVKKTPVLWCSVRLAAFVLWLRE